MHDQEFERYLALLSGMLRLSRGQRESIAQELRDHLEERLAELREAGVDEERAVTEALEEFGDIASLANEFTGVAGTLRRRMIMRFTVGGLGAIGVAAMFLLSFWPTAPITREAGAQAPAVAAPVVAVASNDPLPPPVSGVDAEDVKSTEAYRELAKAIDVAFEEQPLEEALNAFFKKAHLTWNLNRKSLQDEGVDTDTPVTFKVNKVSGISALTMLLDPLELTFVVDDGVVEVVTKVVAETQLSTRVYSVGDLMDSEAGMSDADSLIEVITKFVDPQSWDEVGGRGSVQPFQSMLIVSQTELVHRQLDPLLDDLRRVSQQPPARETAAIGRVGQAVLKKVDWKVAEMPLDDLVQLIQKDLDINVILDAKALQDEGVDLQTMVSLTPGQFSARKAMRMILDPLGLTWLNLRGEVLQITTKVKAEQELDVRLYNVRDLLSPPAGEDADESEPDYDSLIEVVTSTVTPQSWDEVGGRGSVTGYRGMLVISQTETEHDRVAELLLRLRRARERQKGQAVRHANPDELIVKVYRLDNLYLSVSPSAVLEGNAEAEGGEAKPQPVPANNPKDVPKEIIGIVQQMVEPKSWAGGGGKGQIFLLTDSQGIGLVVKQTPGVQREVRALLRTIEREIDKLHAKMNSRAGGGGGFFQ